MKQSAIALIVGIVLGTAGSSLFFVGVEDEVEAPSASAVLPPLPEPYYTVLFENDAVRIVDHQLGSGETEPEHTHPPMLAYFVSGATVLITEADGSTSEVTIPTGTFLGADNLVWWTHALKNTGNTPLHSILVELKQDQEGM